MSDGTKHSVVVFKALDALYTTDYMKRDSLKWANSALAAEYKTASVKLNTAIKELEAEHVELMAAKTEVRELAKRLEAEETRQKKKVVGAEPDE